MMKTKTIKTPLMMAEAYSLSVCPSSLALESKLSRNLESHTGLVPRLSHHEWKKQKKTFISVYRRLNSVRSLFFRFLLAEKESLKGITALVVRPAGCSHPSGIRTKDANALTRASFSARVFEGFC